MKKYYTYTVKKLITVQELISIEYFDVGKDFLYPEETHGFYELLFVEKGGLICETETERLVLGDKEFLLIPPGTAHRSFSAKTEEISKIICICFQSKSGIIPVISGIKQLCEDECELVFKILSEARETFVFPFDKKLTLSSSPRLGSQQLIGIYIEELLIKLVQRVTYNNENFQIALNSSSAKKQLCDEIVKMLESSLFSKITLTDLSNRLFYSKTYLNSIFKEVKGVTIMQYYRDLKIEESKRLLRKKESITAVAEKLSFDSPQYFDKVFKQRVGMTPKEYIKKEASLR